MSLDRLFAALLCSLLAACGAAEDGGSTAAEVDPLIDAPAPAGWVVGTCDPEHLLPPGLHMVDADFECDTPECQYEQSAAALGGRFAGDPATGRRYFYDLDPETGHVFRAICFPESTAGRRLVDAFADDPVVQSRVRRNRCTDGSEHPGDVACADLGLDAAAFGATHDPKCGNCAPTCPTGTAWNGSVCVAANP